MNSNPVFKRHDPQVLAAQLRYFDPESVAAVLLPLDSNRVFYSANAPFPAEVGALAQDFLFEV